MRFRFGQVVLFADDVLPGYRYDFAFDQRPDLRERFDAADETRRRPILKELQKPVPVPGLDWRFVELTRELAAGLRLPWPGRPTVERFMDRAAVEPVEPLEREHNLDGTLHRIDRYACADDCGTGDAYRSMIVAAVDRQKIAMIFDGTHRICALWKRFAAADWPVDLGVFVGQKNGRVAVSGAKSVALAGRPPV